MAARRPGASISSTPAEFLMCQCVARERRARLRSANFVYAMDPGACMPVVRTRDDSQRTPADARRDAASAVELDAPCDFDAGQFIAVQVPGVAGYRGYSMVNFERAARRLEFVVKKKPGGGASEWLFAGGSNGRAVELVRAARRGDFLSRTWAKTSCASPAAAASPA